MTINKKVISIVILGVGACLLSSLFHLYFSAKSQKNQRLLYQIQQLTGKAENLHLMSKSFIQSGNPAIWNKITESIASMQLNLAAVSPSEKGRTQKLAVIHGGLTAYHDLLSRIYNPALLLNREKMNSKVWAFPFQWRFTNGSLTPIGRRRG